MTFAQRPLVIYCLLVVFGSALSGQEISRFDRERADSMLSAIADDVQKHYYDPKYHGVDWAAKVAETKAKVDKATSLNMAMSSIAAALDTLNDSHTYFLPPSRPYKHQFGWVMSMMGDHCMVTHVRPKTDAAAKGLKPGDEILLLNGFRPTRENLWKLNYVFRTLRPQPGLRLQLKDPDGHTRQLDIAADIHQLSQVRDVTGNGIWDVLREDEHESYALRARSNELGNELMVLKIPEFVYGIDEVESMMRRARKYKGLIIDLRGNPGGDVDTLKLFIGNLFDGETKIADRVTRDSTKPMIAKHGHAQFSGKLIVLIDSGSSSASELLARTVQSQKRGTVIGDKSSGSVMESRVYGHHLGMDVMFFYGASVTDADLIMPDGKSLEHVGVTPDEVLLPSAADLAAGRDPVLAHAAQSLDVKLTPEQAGAMFPYEWE